LNGGGRMAASPMTYELDGRQFLIIPVQDILYAFALPGFQKQEHGDTTHSIR